MNLTFRQACLDDVDLYFKWANDPLVRQQSFSSSLIEYDGHCNWFKKKVNDEQCLLLLFLLDDIPCGQVRFEKRENHHYVGVSIDEKYRGMKLAPRLLSLGTEVFFGQFEKVKLVFAEIKGDNFASRKAFESAGYTLYEYDESKFVFIASSLTRNEHE